MVTLMRWLFWILFTIDAIAALILYFFFFAGIGDGSVSEFNMGIWMLVIVAVTASVLIGWILKANGRLGLASLVLAPLAIPAGLYGLFILLLVILEPNWH